MEKNQEIEVEISSYGSEGQGVARVDGFVVFVPNALIGEVVKIHIIKVTKTYAVGKVLEIVKPSKHRVCPECHVFKQCGGCALQHASYQHSLEIKRKTIEDCLFKIAEVKEVNVPEVVASPKIYSYRNKSAFPLVVNEGKLEICMYKNLSHNPVFIDNCYIAKDKINQCAIIFKNFVNENYSLKDKASLKYLVIREIEDKLLVTIVSNSQIKSANKLYFEIKTGLNLANDGLGLFWCKKITDNNVILEGDVKPLLGIKNIQAKIMGISVDISPKSFFQVNTDIMKFIYNRVKENIFNEEVVIDAYSGAGLMSALVAQKAKSVYGVEIVEDATKNANILKVNNKINNLFNINGDASIEIPKLLSEIKKIDTIILDPPRKGVEAKLLETILCVKPQKIIYVSCNPATLARDLKVLSSGYEIKEIQGYDMFPQTSHVETFVLLIKRV